MRHSIGSVAGLLAATALIGCSGGSSVSVANQNPLGTVGGVVIDAANEMPLMGAMVTLLTAGQTLTATTDMNGSFKVINVPSGAFIVDIANAMYETATVNSVLNGAVGNFPVKNPTATIGPIGLIKNDGTFSVKLVDVEASPVPNVTVTAEPAARYVSFANGAPTPVGTYQVTAMSGADGTVAFTGLPDYASLNSTVVSDALPIDVPPVQVSSTAGVYSFLGGTFTFSVNHIGNPLLNGNPMNSNNPVDQATIQLAGPTTALQILNSSIDMLRGLTAGAGAAGPLSFFGTAVIPFIQPTEMIGIEFNQQIDKSTVRAQLFLEDGTTSGPMMATGTNNQLTITPMTALVAGTRYNVALHVDAAAIPGQQSIGRELDVTVPLFVAPATGMQVTVNKLTAKSNVDMSGTGTVLFKFNEPVGIGYGNTNPISCVAFYELPGPQLDNGAGAGATAPFWPGEWPSSGGTQSTTGIGATCPAPGGAIDITAITPQEAEPGMPTTGFTTKWMITFDRAGHPECEPGAASCSFPSPAGNTPVHLLFSHQPGNSTFKLPDGTPVSDNLMNLTFNISN